MVSQDLRKKFLHYFQSKKHTIIPSSPVIPFDDPSLLFVNAGMNQFKNVFLGKESRDYKRAATSQKCIRVGGKHNDLENVGHTSRHLTFFEMLGNFSFGDYFKKEAIAFSFDVATHVFEFPPEKIWVSVFQEDEEAYELWQQHVKTDKIVRFGEKENFWAMGDVGPCGPCSELLFDRGKSFSDAPSPIEDTTGERYFEFWNLVFMQLERNSAGKVRPLLKTGIDTGAGLERVVALKMGVDTLFATDILRAIIKQVEEVSQKKYMGEAAFHVIADHIRTLAFAIADGAQPSNTERGYVLRKVLRRAVRYGRSLGLIRPFLGQILPALIDRMGQDYPELVISQERIREILTLEEEGFIRTLKRGGNLLNQVIEKSGYQISGDDAFKLKDTYGFPIEEIALIAKDLKKEIDLHRFYELEEQAKEKSKKGNAMTEQKFSESLFTDFVKTHKSPLFIGYDHVETPAHVIGIVVDGTFTDQLQEGKEAMVLLDQTPFYAEMGGQVGDEGLISHAGCEFLVTDCLIPYPGIIAHIGILQKGKLKKQDRVIAGINTNRRAKIAANHSATHLLHFALQKIVGEHIRQAGSLVDDQKLRFDFSHHKALTMDELISIENLVNEKIRTDLPVQIYELPYEEVKEKSEIKQFFGEKYGAKVRVVDIDFSKELCGGTHVNRVGHIGLFKIIKETSIAAGIRRIEALTAAAALNYIHQEEGLLFSLSEELKIPQLKLHEKIRSLLEERETLLQNQKQQRGQELIHLAEKLLTTQKKGGKGLYITSIVSVTLEELPAFSELLLSKLGRGVVALGITLEDKCYLVMRISPDVDIDAKEVMQKIAPLIEGGGGGKRHHAQAGGKKAAALSDALKWIEEFLSQ